MLAEELLRAELKKLYGDEVKLFQCDMVGTPPRVQYHPSPLVIEAGITSTISDSI